MQQTAALFDLDGVLVDTEGQYSLFWKAVGASDFPEIPDFADHIKGRTLVQIFQEFYPGNAGRQKSITEQLERFESQMSYAYVPGAMRFVGELRANGIRVAVVTSSNRDKMASLYSQHPDFSAHFDHIFTAEDFTRSKPAPDCYIQAAHYWGLDPKDCYVFEDSINGLRAGRDSGATVVALTTTHSLEEVRPYCRFAIKDFTGFGVEDLPALRQRG